MAVTARGRFSVALSGGSSPKKLYELLASPAYRERVPWAQTFWAAIDPSVVYAAIWWSGSTNTIVDKPLLTAFLASQP